MITIIVKAEDAIAIVTPEPVTKQQTLAAEHQNAHRILKVMQNALDRIPTPFQLLVMLELLLDCVLFAEQVLGPGFSHICYLVVRAI